MEIYQLFLKCLNIYFYLFIIFQILIGLTVFIDTYEENKKNAVKNGTYFNSADINGSLIRWVLFILSIQLT